MIRLVISILVEELTTNISGMNPCRIVIRELKTRCTSCSPKGAPVINSLAKYPLDHLFIIVYHEVCRVVESKDNRYFWDCVGKHVPRYCELERELVAYELKLELNK